MPGESREFVKFMFRFGPFKIMANAIPLTIMAGVLIGLLSLAILGVLYLYTKLVHGEWWLTINFEDLKVPFAVLGLIVSIFGYVFGYIASAKRKDAKSTEDEP